MVFFPYGEVKYTFKYIEILINKFIHELKIDSISIGISVSSSFCDNNNLEKLLDFKDFGENVKVVLYPMTIVAPFKKCEEKISLDDDIIQTIRSGSFSDDEGVSIQLPWVKLHYQQEADMNYIESFKLATPQNVFLLYKNISVSYIQQSRFNFFLDGLVTRISKFVLAAKDNSFRVYFFKEAKKKSSALDKLQKYFHSEKQFIYKEKNKVWDAKVLELYNFKNKIPKRKENEVTKNSKG
eukprot:snap_masked-scaffold_71-processed-gene-0.32-mRNA-1 protein AED:1.00 eAED:1.00 QI:0/0/0/0/1/1/2/0/238